jgi:4-amino-4-deoxy-L-arabinose transferase-like glycosyltransferase
MAIAIVLLTYRVAKRVFSETAAFAAAILVSLYGPLLFFITQLLSTGMAVALGLLSLLALLRLDEKPTRTRAWQFGVSIGLTALVVPNILIALPFLPLLLLRRDRINWRPAAALCAMILLGIAVCISPVTLRNRVVSGEWVLISANGGVNLHIGNNPEFTKTMDIRPGSDWGRLLSVPFENGCKSHADADAFFTRKVMNYAIHEPGSFVKGLLLKSWWLFSSREQPRNMSMYSFGKHSTLLRRLVWQWRGIGFPFGIVGPLALLGLLMSVRKRRAALIAAACLAIYSASLVLFFPSARYRLPMIPVLITFAVYGSIHLGSVIRNVRQCSIGIVLVILTALFMNTHPPFPSDSSNMDAELGTYVGIGLQVRGELSKAITQYESVLESWPDYADAYYYLATALRDSGRRLTAVVYFKECLTVEPEHAKAMHGLALILFQAGEVEDAEVLMYRVIALEPYNTVALKNLGAMLIKRGATAEGMSYIERAELIPVKNLK